VQNLAKLLEDYSLTTLIARTALEMSTNDLKMKIFLPANWTEPRISATHL